MQAARVLIVLTVGALGPLVAQAPAYDSVTLACGRFRESVRGTLEGNLAGGARSERVGRNGVLEVRTVPAGGLVTLEAWFDSLSVFREGPEGRFEPDAAGMLGGRYRGRLEPDGSYQPEARPFIPDGVGEVFDLSNLMQDFLPLLPPDPLRPGGEWKGAPGVTIWRISDSTTADRPIERYRWTRRTERSDTLREAGVSMPVLRRESEEGSLRWRRGGGPAGWRRAIRADVLLQGEAGGTLTVTQEVAVMKIPGSCQPTER